MQYLILDLIAAAIPSNAGDVDMILHNVTRDYSEVWKLIGTELGVEKDLLNIIEESNSSDKDCLRALIEGWLNGAHLTDRTRDALVMVIRSPKITNAIAGLLICLHSYTIY